MALGELERAVMAQLWTAPTPLTVREVHDRLDRELAYTTVMTVLGRLAKKGVVRQERDGKAYRYSAAASREQMAAAVMLDALGDVGEDRTAALVAFADQVGPEEAATLRAALEGSLSAGPLDSRGSSDVPSQRSPEHADRGTRAAGPATGTPLES